MIQELIFAEQTLNFEFEGTTLVCYLEPPPFALSLGETYTMRYGVYSYECESYAVENNGVAIDNGRTDAQSITVVSRAEGVTVVSGGTRSVNIAIYKRTYSASLFDERCVGFHYQSAYGAYGYMTNEAQVLLTEGEKYYVIWDDTEYEVQAYDASSVLPGYLYLGNGSAFGLQGDSEPFIIASSGEFLACLSTVDTEELSHWIAIYTAESSEFAPNDIILKRYSGEEKVFKGVDVVRLTHASNKYTVPYTFGEAVENIPITLDLKDGDQTVTAPEGTLVKSAVISKPVNLTPENIRSGKKIANVTGEFVGESEPLIVGTSEGAVALDWSAGDQIITPVTDGKPFSPVTLEKPATLLPENIAEGIDIAGIIGTFAGGGGVKIASGSFTGDNTKTSTQIRHGLGVLPDLIIVFCGTQPFGTGDNRYYVLNVWGVSAAMRSKCGFGYYGACALCGAITTTEVRTAAIDTTSTAQVICNANTHTFDISGKISTREVRLWNSPYYWAAIAGLTE